MEKQIIDGIIFRRYPNSNRSELKNYFISSATELTGYKTKRLHRYIWEKYYGEIPKGFHIHHKDYNTTNNDISNLQLVSPKEHNIEHYYKMLPKWKEQGKKIIELASRWSKTPEGKKFRKEQGIKNAVYFPRYEITRNCDQCGKEYIAKTTFGKFCHNNCKAKALRKRRSLC